MGEPGTARVNVSTEVKSALWMRRFTTKFAPMHSASSYDYAERTGANFEVKRRIHDADFTIGGHVDPRGSSSTHSSSVSKAFSS